MKHALISDERWADLLANESFTSPSIEWLEVELLRGIAVESYYCCEDEFEQSTRKYLNFGHTFGHAVEAALGFGGLSHGESIMIGMAYSLILSEMNGEIDERLTAQYIDFAASHGYTFKPVHEHTFETFMGYMQKDKKASFGKLNFVLLQVVGKPYVKEITSDQCSQAFEQLKLRTEGLK